MRVLLVYLWFYWRYSWSLKASPSHLWVWWVGQYQSWSLSWDQLFLRVLMAFPLCRISLQATTNPRLTNVRIESLKICLCPLRPVHLVSFIFAAELSVSTPQISTVLEWCSPAREVESQKQEWLQGPSLETSLPSCLSHYSYLLEILVCSTDQTMATNASDHLFTTTTLDSQFVTFPYSNPISL